MYACRGGAVDTVDWLCSQPEVLAQESGNRKPVLLGNAANGRTRSDFFTIPQCTDRHFSVVKLLIEKYQLYDAEIAAATTSEGQAECAKYIQSAIIGGSIPVLRYLIDVFKFPVEYLAVRVCLWFSGCWLSGDVSGCFQNVSPHPLKSACLWGQVSLAKFLVTEWPHVFSVRPTTPVCPVEQAAITSGCC